MPWPFFIPDTTWDRSYRHARYFEMVVFHLWKPRTLWNDLVYGVKHAVDLHWTTRVGEMKWQEWMARLMARSPRAN